MNSVQSSVTSNQLEGKRLLPEGWVWTTLEECVDILDNRRVPINSDEREQRITGKELSELYPYYGATGLVGWIDDFIFDEEIVLLGEDGAPFLETTKNKAYIVRGKCWVNNHAHVLRAKDGITTNLFMMHYLNLFDYHGYVTGTTRLKLNQGRMREFPIVLPPLPEQERIVARLEELLSDLEAGVAALERVRAGAKRYKASVLKAACEGKLFGDKGIVNRELPEGWEWTTLGESCDIVLGQSPSSDTYNTDENGLPFYQGKAEFGDLYPTPEKWCSSPKKIAEENDILITVRAPVGPTNLCPEKSCIGRGLAAIRPRNGMPTKFFLYFLRYIEKEWDIKATGTTFKAITGDVLRNQEMPLPPMDEQRRIVAEVERRLESARAVESAVEAGLKRSARLRQAVLRSAFEGKLSTDSVTDSRTETD